MVVAEDAEGADFIGSYIAYGICNRTFQDYQSMSFAMMMKTWPKSGRLLLGRDNPALEADVSGGVLVATLSLAAAVPQRHSGLSVIRTLQKCTWAS